MKLDKFKGKNKYYFILLLTVLGVCISYFISNSYGKYKNQERFHINDNKVQNNNNNIPIIAINIDGKPAEKMPEKDNGVYFENAKCNNNIIGSWDRDNWQFLLSGKIKPQTKCTLNFTTANLSNQNSISKMEGLLAQEKGNEKLGSVIEDWNNNIRYIGRWPNNYIYFNCKENTEQNAEGCEKWRIIGLMDNIQTKEGKTERLLKIIREPFKQLIDGQETGDIITLSWDSSESEINNGQGVNEWSQADIMTVLNNDYFNAQAIEGHKCYTGGNNSETTCPDWTKIGLNKTARNMVEEVIWNTGTTYSLDYNDTNLAQLQYLWERSDSTGKQCKQDTYLCSDQVDREAIWTGHIGLMYPSDYEFATDGDKNITKRGQCLSFALSDWYYSTNNYCKINDWLYIDKYQWTMTPAPGSANANSVFNVFNGGYVSTNYASLSSAIRPVVYLKSSVKIIGGTGSDSEPFQLKLEEN